jgi:alanine racemase
MMVDVTEVAERMQVGSEVVLLGAQGDARIAAEEMAAWCDTIPYEIFCAIGARVPRVAT